MHSITDTRGYVALISILILSTLLLTTTLSLAQLGIAQRYFNLNNENKAISKKLAEACVHIGQMYFYTYPEEQLSAPLSFPVGGNKCSIISLLKNQTITTLITQAEHNEAVTTLEVTFDFTSGLVTNWQEK